MVKYAFCFFLIISSVQLVSAQVEITNGTWYRTYKVENVYGSDELFDLFKFNPKVDSLYQDSVFIKEVDPDTGEFKYARNLRYRIDTDNNLIVSDRDKETLYKPYVGSDNYIFTRICFAKSIEAVSYTHLTLPTTPYV